MAHACPVVRRHSEFTGMARIEELPEGLKVADLFNGAEGVGGLTTMLAVCHFTSRVATAHVLRRQLPRRSLDIQYLLTKRQSAHCKVGVCHLMQEGTRAVMSYDSFTGFLTPRCTFLSC